MHSTTQNICQLAYFSIRLANLTIATYAIKKYNGYRQYLNIACLFRNGFLFCYIRFFYSKSREDRLFRKSPILQTYKSYLSELLRGQLSTSIFITCTKQNKDNIPQIQALFEDTADVFSLLLSEKKNTRHIYKHC